MNKKEFIHALSEHTGFSKVDAKKALEASLAIIAEQLKLDSKTTFLFYLYAVNALFIKTRKLCRKVLSSNVL